MYTSSLHPSSFLLFPTILFLIAENSGIVEKRQRLVLAWEDFSQLIDLVTSTYTKEIGDVRSQVEEKTYISVGR